jgi:hypothetical protein
MPINFFVFSTITFPRFPRVKLFYHNFLAVCYTAIKMREGFMKRIVLAVALLLMFVPISVQAWEDMLWEDMPWLDMPQTYSEGYILEIDGSIITIEGLVTGHVFRVNVLCDAVIIDAITGSPATLQDREHDRIKVYTISRAMALTDAAIVVVNQPLADRSPNRWYSVPPHYFEVERVEFLNDDTLHILADWEQQSIIVDRNVPIISYITGEAVALEGISAGAGIIIWAEYDSTFIPWRVYATRVLLLCCGDSVCPPVWISAETPQPNMPRPVSPIPVHGTGILYNGTELFPLRSLAEENGFSVFWFEYDSAALLHAFGSRGTYSTELYILVILGERNFYAELVIQNRGRFEEYVHFFEFELSYAPIIQNRRMFVPADFFDTLHI